MFWRKDLNTRGDRFQAGDVLDALLHLGDAGHAADQDHLVHVGLRQLRVGKAALAGADQAVEDPLAQLLELRPRDVHLQVLRQSRVV